MNLDGLRVSIPTSRLATVNYVGVLCDFMLRKLAFICHKLAITL